MIELAIALLYPLSDGKCNEYAALKAQTIEAAAKITFYVFQDSGYVWLCHTAPGDRHSWDDFVVRSPKHPDGLNLHASAQLGAWPASDPASAPTDGASDKWWDISGWWANTPHPNDNEGMARAREYQLSKEAFGRGEWKVEATVNGVNEDGSAIIVPLTIKAE